VKKGEEKKETIYFVGNTPMLANWMQIEMGKTLKTIKVEATIFNFWIKFILIFYIIQTCSKSRS
jgi:hypothetical protein